MVTKELLDFIKNANDSGQTYEQIKNQLTPNGWNLNDIEEGFKTVVPLPTSYNYNNVILPSTLVQTKSHSRRKIFFIVLILFLLAGGALAYYFKDRIMSSPIVEKIFSIKINQL